MVLAIHGVNFPRSTVTRQSGVQQNVHLHNFVQMKALHLCT